MSPRKRLSVVSPGSLKLGQSTIMDRALAQRHGAPYVHLAAFAIDVDRVRLLEGERTSLPFGFEVLLTELRLARYMDETQTDPSGLLEDMCLSAMDLSTSGEGVLGAQLPFAIYAGVAHGHLPTTLGNCFRSWKKPPLELADELGALAAQPGLVSRLAEHCLEAKLTPPLVEPVRTALEAMRDAADPSA